MIVVSSGVVPGAASLHLVGGVSLLRPEEQVFSAMLAGFANQQLARNLARSTVEGRENKGFEAASAAIVRAVLFRDLRAVERPRRNLINGRIVGQACDVAPVRIHQEDVALRADVAGESDLRAVGRPCRAGVVARVVREVGLVAAVRIHDVDVR